MRGRFALFSATVVLSGALATFGSACTSPCFDYGGFDSTERVVAFEADVLPLLRTSCGLSSSCHGSPTSTRPYLGPKLADPLTPTDIDLIFSDNVGVPAVLEPEMSLVEPGDPEHSFLMHKMDGTFTCKTLACSTDATCGDTMPQGAKLLAPDLRQTVRLWIAQGAKKD